eukprot:957538_1
MARESEEYNLSLENWQSLRDALQFNVEVLHDLECTVCGETLGRGFAKRIRLEECAGCMLLLRAAQTRQKSLEVFKLKCSTLKIEQKDIQTNKDKADGDLTLFKTNEYNLTKQIEAKQIAIDSEEIQYHDAVQQENVRHERLLRSLKEQTGIRMDELNEEMRVFKQKQNEAVDEVRICAQKIEQYLKELEAISYEKFSADKEYNEKEELASQVFDCEYGAIKSNVRTAVQGSQSVCSAPTRDGNEESNPYGYEYNEEEATRDGNEETPHGNETTRDGNEETQSYGSEKPQSYGYEDTIQQSYGNEDTTLNNHMAMKTQLNNHMAMKTQFNNHMAMKTQPNNHMAMKTQFHNHMAMKHPIHHHQDVESHQGWLFGRVHILFLRIQKEKSIEDV